MTTILLKNVFHEGTRTNILIEGDKFKSIGVPAEAEAAQTIDCDGLAILPAFYNTHTHAAMTLVRGYADDLPLQTWLQDYIWPYESKLTASDIRRGSEMAAREMISTGSVFFNDMYFEIQETIDCVRAGKVESTVVPHALTIDCAETFDQVYAALSR